MPFICFLNLINGNFDTVKTFFLFCLTLFFLSCSTKEKDKSVVLARVENDILTVNNLNRSLSIKQKDDGLVKSYIYEWIDNTLLYNEAVLDGINKDQALIKKRDEYFKKLIISSYIETKTLPQINIQKREIRQYYKKNKDSFIRSSDAASIYHFITDNLEEARSIRKQLLKKKSGDSISELFKQYSVELKTVNKNRLIEKLDLALFNKLSENIIGPIKTDAGYHVIEVLDRYKKGDVLGLEEVYDEIYQRILKKEKLTMLNNLIDSLKTKTNIFINAGYK